MNKKFYDVCLVGATGLVGQTFLKVLEEVDFPIRRLRLLASARSAGKVIIFKDKDYHVETLTADAFDGYQLAFFSAGGSISTEYAPIARDKGLVVIDNSSAWREHPEIGLVVPEVNFPDAKLNKLIANPNCSTIQSVLPLSALKPFGLKSISYSTYQAVSGSGASGQADLVRTLAGEAPIFYPHDISQTCIPQIDVFLENDYTKEEMKMVNETRKILNLPDLPVSATCVRVPVMNGHAVSVRVELENAFEISDIVAAFEAHEGIVIANDGANHLYPTSVMAEGAATVFVGRIRRDLSAPNGLLFYCVADNIRKGAATNAVQIALKMANEDLI
ncbi:MAG: aspartate-semialdehyde dehydrogenase [Defluviitaleaceae bacterium]|nr:aspartate-semialdehyde dehydrogenase [Defluviitaleaceae bacterium]